VILLIFETIRGNRGWALKQRENLTSLHARAVYPLGKNP
jgi:hypothetical protein